VGFLRGRAGGATAAGPEAEAAPATDRVPDAADTAADPARIGPADRSD
jgi:hypothetical protein